MIPVHSLPVLLLGCEDVLAQKSLAVSNHYIQLQLPSLVPPCARRHQSRPNKREKGIANMGDFVSLNCIAIWTETTQESICPRCSQQTFGDTDEPKYHECEYDIDRDSDTDEDDYIREKCEADLVLDSDRYVESFR